MELAVFEQLEKKVEKIITLNVKIKEENKKLADVLNLKNKEIESLQSKLDKISKEKGLVKDKVESLLLRLEELIQTT